MAPLQLNSSPLIFRLVYLSAYKIHRIPSLPVSLYLSFSHPRCPRFDATLTTNLIRGLKGPAHEYSCQVPYIRRMLDAPRTIFLHFHEGQWSLRSRVLTIRIS
ncbi:hypothetical protein ACN38_g7117 [Penicillium nordicum]|uniref:Uncharacterized protein n=1 Tax=Penicillium nordicum TaxID=229535 RepID=A0A0M9WES2_9EURO|nr:hypothetical protein ACN38_g7117 [Penicillium nordicum]